MHARAAATHRAEPTKAEDSHATSGSKRAALRGLDFAAQEAALRPAAAEGNKTIDPSALRVIVNDAPVVKVTAGGTGYGSCIPKVFVALDEGMPAATPGGWRPEGALSAGVTVNLNVRPDKTDVSSPDSGAITAENQAQAKSDLTPNAGGYAPRTKFYSRRLSQRHELVHAEDYKAAARTAIDERLAELRTTVVGDAATARARTVTCLEGVQGDLIEAYAGPGKRTAADCLDGAAMESYMARPGEAHAFGDGKPEYEALVAGIAKRFDGGK